jgi:hypothetical protein
MKRIRITQRGKLREVDSRAQALHAETCSPLWLMDRQSLFEKGRVRDCSMMARITIVYRSDRTQCGQPSCSIQYRHRVWLITIFLVLLWMVESSVRVQGSCMSDLSKIAGSSRNVGTACFHANIWLASTICVLVPRARQIWLQFWETNSQMAFCSPSQLKLILGTSGPMHHDPSVWPYYFSHSRFVLNACESD